MYTEIARFRVEFGSFHSIVTLWHSKDGDYKCTQYANYKTVELCKGKTACQAYATLIGVTLC